MRAALVAFRGTRAMWWLYFGTSSRDATAAIVRSRDPGRMGAHLHDMHAMLIGWIIAAAVGSDVVLARPFGTLPLAQGVALAAVPCRYRLGRAVCKRVVYGLVPRSSILAAAARVLLAPRAERVDLLTLATLDTAMRLVQWRTGRGAWGGVGRTPRGAGSPAALRPRIAARAPAHKL